MSQRPATDARAPGLPVVPFDAFLQRVIAPVPLAAALLVLTLGCETAITELDETTEATTLEVQPASATLAPGETVGLDATPRDGDGNAVSGYTISWSSGDGSVATVDGDGTVTAEATGSTQITATAEKDGHSLSGQAQVTVEEEGGDGGGDGSSSASLVTDLEPSAYETDTLETGEPVYVDRPFVVESVPSGYSGWTYVRTANDDKSATDDSAVTFALQDTATVALGYDERANTLPDWLADWTATGDTLRTDDVDFPVFTRIFDAGDVALGGNMSGGAEGANSMYVLFAAASDSTPDDGGGDGGGDDGGGDDTATGSLEVTTATSGDDPDPDGYTVSVQDGPSQSIGTDETVVLDGLEVGDRSVQLSGVASNCSVTGDNPQTVTINENTTAATAFDISCETAPSPSPSDVPAPDSNDLIYYDMRAGGAQSLQDAAIQTIDDARNMLPNSVLRGMPQEPAFQPYITDSFLNGHPNSDLQGVKAFGMPIHHDAGNESGCLGNGLPPNGSQQNMQIYIRAQNTGGGPVGDAGETVFLQFKRYFGRTAADTHASAIGPVDHFRVHHQAEGDDGGPGGRKWVVWKRPDGSERLDLLKQDYDGDFDVPLANSLNILGMNRGEGHLGGKISLGEGKEGTENVPWWPDAHFPQHSGTEGGPFTFTLRIKLESSPGAGDGELTWWVDGTIYEDQDGLSPGALGFNAEIELGFPTWICPPQDQTEYLWDVVVWKEQ